MATYGRRRKGPLSSFNVFQDEEPNHKFDTLPRTAGDDKPRSALAPKTTNLKTKPRKQDGLQIRKAEISSPVLQSTTAQGESSSARPITSHSTKTVPSAQPSHTEPVDLNRKISNLMRQAAIQEAESKRKTSILESELAKPSPRQRAKQAMVKASRAVKDKLTSGNGSVQSSPRHGPKTESLIDFLLGSEALDDVRSGTLRRRAAEGANLSNPKIQSLMGDSSVRKKPLPIYESMRARIQHSSAIEDPFMDDTSIEDTSQFDFGFTEFKPKDRTETAKGPEDVEVSDQQVTSRPQSRFSSAVSGLAQHSDTMYFSSSPEATSTPQSKLVSRSPEVCPKKYNKAVPITPKKKTGEAQTDDERSLAPSTTSKTIKDGSQSVKRKSAQENLRSNDTPMAKKARISSNGPRDTASNLPSIMSNLATQDDDLKPLSPEPMKTKNQRQGSKTDGKKGLKIFEVKKGKAPESKAVKQLGVKRPQTSKRASFSRPSSMLFGREPKIGGKGKFAKLDDNGDDMDVDELA